MLPLTWNANRKQLSSRESLTHFHIKWINYLTETQGWQSIDTALAFKANMFELSLIHI